MILATLRDSSSEHLTGRWKLEGRKSRRWNNRPCDAIIPRFGPGRCDDALCLIDASIEEDMGFDNPGVGTDIRRAEAAMGPFLSPRRHADVGSRKRRKVSVMFCMYGLV